MSTSRSCEKSKSYSRKTKHKETSQMDMTKEQQANGDRSMATWPISRRDAGRQMFGAAPDHGDWELEFFSPQRAEQILSEMEFNRDKRKRNLKKLATAMLRRRFVLTHQGVAFGPDGKLKDGQHRLTAIVETGLGQWMWVYRYPTASAADAPMDEGAMRGAKDVAGYLGIPISHEQPAIARRMLAVRLTRGLTLDDSDLFGFIWRHREAIEFARKELSKPGMRDANVRAPVARAFYHYEHYELTSFCGIVNGAPFIEETSAPVRLKDQLLRTAAGRHSRQMQFDTYEKTESALRLFHRRQAVQKIVGVSTELFPIPEDALDFDWELADKWPNLSA